MTRSELGAESDYGRPLPIALEELVQGWVEVAAGLPLDVEEQRTADGLAHLVGELAKNERPDLGLVQAAVGWFKLRLDMYADEFATSASCTPDQAGAVATGANVANLSQLIDKILTLA